MWNQIFVNILSDIIFLLILIAFGWLLFLVTQRFKLLRFFGIEKTRRIVIYLSNLRVTPYGAIGVDGKKRSYEGSAGAFGEIHVANRFRNLFNYILPSLSNNPGVLSKLLISDVKVQILQSPLNQGELETSASFVTLGTPAYNVASGFVENHPNSQAQFELGVSSKNKSSKPNKDGFVILPTTHSTTIEATVTEVISPSPSGTASAYQDAPLVPSASGMVAKEQSLADREPEINVDGIHPITDTTYGFVERIRDNDTNRNIFYVAGLSELSTTGAADYLIENWRELQNKYGYEKNFIVMLRFEPTDYKKWTIAFER